MLARLLLGVLALGVPEEPRKWPNDEESDATVKAGMDWSDIQSASRLHVGMLAISLIACLGFGAYAGYSCWTQKNALVGHVRNLAIAFFCRIFFAIIFDGVVILGSDASDGGGKALLAFECISQNLVFAFWLMLTVYLHAQVQRKFNSEPSLNLYEYGIPGVAVFFALVWIFALQAEYPYLISWLFSSSLSQWIVNALRLLYLLIQLGLVADMGRVMLKISTDNDSLSLLRKSAAALAALIFLFWLQFGLSLGRFWHNASYQHFDYFVDGSAGALACLGLFFLQMWVPSLFNRIPSIATENARTSSDEVLLAGDRGIATIDKVFMTRESGRWKGPDRAGEESKDVVYSTVVEPHRLKKTLELYKRLNVLPSSQVTAVEGEEFFDCSERDSMRSKTTDSERADFLSVISDDPMTPPGINRQRENAKPNNQVQKRNAFYASKYLIVEPKGGDVPKLLETRPSVSSAGKDSTKENGTTREVVTGLDALMSDDLVIKWLNEHSDNLQAERKPIPAESVPPTKEKLTPTAKSVLRLKNKVVPTIEPVTQTKDQPEPTVQTVPELKDKSIPTSQFVPELRDKPTPTAESVSQVKDEPIPTVESVPESKDKSISTVESVLELKDEATPTALSVRDSNDKVKPIVQSVPESKDKLKPIVQSVPESKDKVKPTALSVPESKDKLKPIVQSVPELRDKPMETVESVPQPKEKPEPMARFVPELKDKPTPISDSVPQPKARPVATESVEKPSEVEPNKELESTETQLENDTALMERRISASEMSLDIDDDHWSDSEFQSSKDDIKTPALERRPDDAKTPENARDPRTPPRPKTGSEGRQTRLLETVDPLPRSTSYSDVVKKKSGQTPPDTGRQQPGTKPAPERPVPAPASAREESSSDSSFDLESSHSSSSFSLDTYYSNLRNAREKSRDFQHPFGRRPKRAKLSE